MRHGKTGFSTEGCERLVGVHVQVARIRPHVTGNKSRCIKGFRVGVFDRGNVGGLDPKLALDIQQGFTKRRAFTAHQVTKAQVERVETFGFNLFVICRLGRPPPNHKNVP